ncbi:ferredoxin [Streptomyces sp. NPDC017179]|uniref:ferredoxin n=1 Tax=Streptomyces sp. NPDC017179 TaxID=3364979 RepID=UPI00379720F0
MLVVEDDRGIAESLVRGLRQAGYTVEGVRTGLIDLDEWGYPVLKDRAVPDHLRVHARQAVAACPRLALHTDRGRPGRP